MSHEPHPLRIAIADDHPIFLDGLRRLLSAEPGFTVVGEAVEAIGAAALVRERTPDALLLDLLMPHGGGLGVLRDLAINPPPTRVIVLTADIEKPEILTVIRLGARGVLMKECAPALLVKCIRCVIGGEYWIGRQAVGDLVAALLAERGSREGRPRAPVLTPRELDIVAAIVESASNQDVAARLGLSPQTVKNYLSGIFTKLGVSNRRDLALYVVEHQLLASHDQAHACTSHPIG